MSTFKTIKNRLPLMFFAIAVVICTVLGVVSQSTLKTEMTGSIERLMETYAQSKKHELQVWITDVEDQLNIVSSSTSALKDATDLDRAFRAMGASARDELRRRFIDENPHPSAERIALDASDESDRYDIFHRRLHSLFRRLVTEKGYSDVFLVSPGGDVIYSASKRDDFATNLGDGPYAESGLATAFRTANSDDPGVVSFSQFEPYAAHENKAAAFAATPLINGFGQRVGVIVVKTPIEGLKDTINTLNTQDWLGSEGRVYLVDEKFHLNSPSLAEEDEFQLLSTVPRTAPVLASLSGETKFFEDTTGISGNRIVAYATSVDFLGAPRGLVVEAEHDVSFAVINRDRLILTILSIGIALLIGVLGFFMARSVTKPLLQIRDDMIEISGGNLDVTISGTERQDEFGMIAKTLQDFAEKLTEAKAAEQIQHQNSQEQADAVEKLSEALTKLREGDLTFSLSESFASSYDRLRINFNKSIETLNHALAQVVESADSIRNGAEEISHASDDLSNRTENQAATLEQTAAALDQLTASVKSAADGARSVEQIVSEAKEEATQSGEVVKTAVEAMNEIEASSDQISEIIGVIDDIAFQTNLLALNAGVEAARAGESGKGFSVVASEVRALAQRSSEAAHEIKALISGSTIQVEKGVHLVGKAGGALNNIVERVNHIAKLVSDIAAGASEQSAGLGEINIGVTQLDQVTQQNAAMVEEATAASHILQKDTSVLSELVAGFSIRTERTPEIDDFDDQKEDDLDEPTIIHDETVQIAPKRLPEVANGTDDFGWQDF